MVSLTLSGDSAVKRVCEEFCNELDWNQTQLPSDDERGKVNQDIVDRLMANFPGKNVLVVLTEHDANLEDSAHVELDIHGLGMIKPKFHVYVFKSGEFTLRGDGGMINWCFNGNYERHGDKRVTFSELSTQ